MLKLALFLSGRDWEKINLLQREAPAAIDRAVSRSIKKVGEQLRSKVARESAKALGVRLVAMRRRVRAFLKKEIYATKIWLGINPIGIQWFGTPRRNRRGVRVGTRQFDGAFIARGKSVFRREGKRRLPIKRIAVDVKGDMKAILERHLDDLEINLRDILRHEINYELSKLFK